MWQVFPYSAKWICNFDVTADIFGNTLLRLLERLTATPVEKNLLIICWMHTDLDLVSDIANDAPWQAITRMIGVRGYDLTKRKHRQCKVGEWRRYWQQSATKPSHRIFTTSTWCYPSLSIHFWMTSIATWGFEGITGYQTCAIKRKAKVHRLKEL